MIRRYGRHSTQPFKQAERVSGGRTERRGEDGRGGEEGERRREGEAGGGGVKGGGGWRGREGSCTWHWEGGEDGGGRGREGEEVDSQEQDPLERK
jgi:hypothetical protein